MENLLFLGGQYFSTLGYKEFLFLAVFFKILKQNILKRLLR